MSLIVLFLFANEDETHLCIVHNELNLLLTARCIERYCYRPNPISAEVGVEILQAVLCKDGNILLRFHAKVEQSIAHLLHAQREMVPRNGFPFVPTEVFKCQGWCIAILASLLMNE